ncbi:MAG: hypothetical protein H7A21_17675 [Spirochaetales bacterium]|nr:hypothetical protein [Leptospiraceae bacterium]MCP5483270.1 hypothetical protein [Spirochaetales bacterium]
MRPAKTGLSILLGLSLVVSAPALSAQESPAPEQARPRRTLPATHEATRSAMAATEIDADLSRRFLYAREIYADGYVSRALAVLEDLLILAPRHELRFEMLREAARALETLGRQEEARDYYVQAFETAPGLPAAGESYLQAARLEARLGRQEQARMILDRIRRQYPDSTLSRQADLELRALAFPPPADSADDATPASGAVAPETVAPASPSSEQSEPGTSVDHDPADWLGEGIGPM